MGADASVHRAVAIGGRVRRDACAAAIDRRCRVPSDSDIVCAHAQVPIRRHSAGQSRRAPALGCGRSAGTASLWRAQPLQDHRARRDHGRDVDWRRRMARRPGRRGQVFVGDFPDCDDCHPAAGPLQPRGDSLHALHRRADLRRHHAAQARTQILGGVLHRGRVLSARMAGARGQRRRDAARRVDGAHAGRARPGGAGLGRERPDSLRRAHPFVWRHHRAHARVLRVDDARRRLPVSARHQHRVRADVALAADVPGILQLHWLTAADRLGADWRARRNGRVGRNRQPDGHQLDSRQGLRDGRQGWRDPERCRRTRDSTHARRHGVSRDAQTIWSVGASG